MWKLKYFCSLLWFYYNEILLALEICTKLAGAVDSLKGREALQSYLDRLERWAITSPIKFNKCQILHLGWHNPCSTYKLVDKSLESSPVKRHWVLNWWQVQYERIVYRGSQKSQLYPGVHQAQHHWPVEGGDCPALFCSDVASTRVLCAVLGTSV